MEQHLYVSASICLAVVVVGLILAEGPVRAEMQTNWDVEDKFRTSIGSWISFFESNLAWFSETMVEFMKNAIKATYFTVSLARFVMWATGLAKYSGKRLIIGAMLLALVSEILL